HVGARKTFPHEKSIPILRYPAASDPVAPRSVDPENEVFMRIGVYGFPGPGWLDDVVAKAHQAADDGMQTFWMGQAFSIDALTSLAVVGREVPGIELAVGVVPIQTRHPQALAAQALAVQAAAGGRFTLGLGVSHRHTAEGRWGATFDR